jgi:hypothetical protein
MSYRRIEHRQSVPPWKSRFAPYVAGFLDGDGCISLNVPSQPGKITVTFTNTDLKVLQWLQKIIGGKSHLRKRTQAFSHRKQTYNLSTLAYTAIGLLQGLEPYLLLKKSLAQQAIWYHDTPINAQIRYGYRPTIEEACLQQSPCIQPEGPCPPWLWKYYAGFFDAEGHCHVRSASNRMIMALTQKHACVLQFLQHHAAIKSHLAQITRHGVPTHEHQLVYGASAATALCKRLLPHLRIKATQARLFIAFRDAYEQNQLHLRPGIEAQLRALTRLGPQGQLELFPLHNLGHRLRS